jgi:hypothetical protein
MNPRRDAPSAADLASEANGLATGLGMLTMIYTPFALPALLLALPLVLPLSPLLIVAGIGYLLFRLLLLPIRLIRSAWQRRPHASSSAAEHQLSSGPRSQPAPIGTPATRR